MQRSREAAELARRRFMEVDPGNRLVADVLESEWNQCLKALRDAEDERNRLRDQDRILLDESIRKRVQQLATDFPRLWNDPATPNREKKRMIRLLIEDVTLTRHGDRAHAGVRLRGGATRELDVSLQAAIIRPSFPPRSSPKSASCCTTTQTSKSPTSSINVDEREAGASRSTPACLHMCASDDASKPSVRCCDRRGC